jgi:hypothetical protein
MSAQLSIRKEQLQLWLHSERLSVDNQIREVVSSSKGTQEILFQVSVLEYRKTFILSQIKKLSKQLK